MRSILEELYLGNLNPNEHTRMEDPEYLQMLAEVVRQEEQLRAKLPEEQRKLLEQWVNGSGGLAAWEIRLRFAEGFRLGARVMLDVLDSDP